MTALPSIAGYRVRRLTGEDAPLLQDLWARCTDFHRLQEGEPTRDTAGAEDLAALPPGKTSEDKFAFGIATGERLSGYVDLVRDYPTPGEWSLGLLLIDPLERSRGLGTRIYAAASEWAAAQGAKTILIGVLEQNPRAALFWERRGFREIGQQEFVAGSGHASRIRVMRHALPSSLRAGRRAAGDAPSCTGALSCGYSAPRTSGAIEESSATDGIDAAPPT